MGSTKGERRVKSRVKSAKKAPEKGSTRVKFTPREPDAAMDLPSCEVPGKARRHMTPETSSAELQQLQLAQTHLAAALEQLRTLSTRAATEAKSYIQSAAAALDGSAASSSKLDPERFRTFASLLRQRRRAVKLSQQQLADRAKLHRSTVKNIESLRQAPSRSTLARLLSVPELGLQVDDVATHKTPSGPFEFNHWFSPGYDPVSMGQELVRVVNSRGGHLEQTFQYLDAQSAAAWITLANSGRYAQAFRAACPLERVAARTAELFGAAPVDVIALGPGDGRAEVRFSQHLLDHLPSDAQLQLKLLDISHALLGTAYRHAIDLLEPRGVPIQTLHADFHHLMRYPELHYRPPGAPHRPRVFLLLGNTLANIDNELRFFQQLHGAALEGDLAVIDCQLAAAPADRPEEIRRLDATIRAGKPSDEHAAWLAGPFRRHGRDVADVKITVELRQACAVPGSYEADAVATVYSTDGSTRRFSSWRVRRYDPEVLAKSLRELGWKKELLLRYGPDGKPAAAVMLLRREADSAGLAH